MTVDMSAWLAVAAFLSGCGVNLALIGRWTGRIQERVDSAASTELVQSVKREVEGVAAELTRQRQNTHDIRAQLSDVSGKVQWIEGRLETHDRRLDHLESRCDQRHP